MIIESSTRHGIPMICWYTHDNQPIYRAPTRDQYILVKIPTRPLRDNLLIRDMIDWCKENCKKEYLYPNVETSNILPYQQFYFKDRNDALMFKITWN